MFDKLLYAVCKFICYAFLKIYCRLEVRGRQYVPESGPAIIACNHVSFLDPVIAGMTTGRKVNFLARASLFETRLLGGLIRRLGAYPLQAEGGNDIAAIKKSLKLLQKGEIIIIFPEGTRSLNGSLQEAQAGVGMLAFKSQSPVVPVYISGAEKALARGSRILRPAKIIARVGSPVYPAAQGSQFDYNDFSSQVLQVIRSLQHI